MSSSMFGDDPWENGWNDENANTPTGGPDTNLATSTFSGEFGTQLAEDDEEDINTFKFDEARIPNSFKVVYQKLKGQLLSGNDFERLILDKLVENHRFSGYQRTKIMNAIFDHNLVHFSHASNFYQSLGLVSLELDVAGTGDYVTLQFKISDLPELPEAVVGFLTQEEETKSFVDPLTDQLASASVEDDWKTPLQTAQQTLLKGEDEQPAAPSEITKYINDLRDSFKVLYDSKEVVNIKEVPEKGGMIFKHINYAITHQIVLGMNSSAGPKRVNRRYSDFVWLLEFLLKKYPFRIIPGLPPKKFTGASPDSQFLQRRRRGLQRFLNQLIKHPVLRKEPVVVTFLSVPTDLTSWKKQAQIDYSLEFKGIKISTQFMNSIWPAMGEDFLKKWRDAETCIQKLIDIWTKLVILVERYERRQQQIAYDNNKFMEMLGKFQDLNNNLYPHLDEKDSIIANSNSNDLNAINSSLHSASEFFTNSSQLIVDETYTINTSVLEKFKNYLDYLYSLLELFDRSKRLSANNIPSLQARIRENEQKFTNLSNEDADIKGSDLAKLKQIIINDKQEMFHQLNKDWLIKECCLQEYVMFQETQFLVSELWTDWSRGRTKFHSRLSGLFASMDNVVSNDMPLGR